VKNCRSSPRLRRRDPGRPRNRQCARFVALTLAGFALLGLLIGTATAATQTQDGKYVIKRIPGRVKLAPAGDAASGQATAKKHIGTPKYGDIKLNVSRDAASGKATGKRSYKPITFTKRFDKATPMMAAPSKQTGGIYRGGLLDGNAMGGSTTGSPAATGAPINRGGAPAGRLY
jgi:hypothetical protein